MTIHKVSHCLFKCYFSLISYMCVQVQILIRLVYALTNLSSNSNKVFGMYLHFSLNATHMLLFIFSCIYIYIYELIQSVREHNHSIAKRAKSHD